MTLPNVLNKEQGTLLGEFSVYERFKADFVLTWILYSFILGLYVIQILIYDNLHYIMDFNWIRKRLNSKFLDL